MRRNVTDAISLGFRPVTVTATRRIRPSLSADQHRTGFAYALASAAIRDAVADATDDERHQAAAFTAERLSAAPSFTQAAMRGVASVLVLQVRLVHRARFDQLGFGIQQQWVERWSATKLPGVADYVDAVRGLALTWLFEHRAA
jgi:hypothetical protein